MNEQTVNIRDIQHYMYCPRRYSLLTVNRDWCENAFVTKANILHEHVHDGTHDYSDNNKVVRSDITIYNDLSEYDIFGVVDCIEFVRFHNGVTIQGLEGKYKVRIIEYKPRAPKGKSFNETDAIQVFAQKICADYLWGCNSETFLYYSDIRRRVKLPFDEEYDVYDTKLKKLLSEMRNVLKSHIILPIAKGQKCSGCSIADICFPKDKKYNVKDIILSQIDGECKP